MLVPADAGTGQISELTFRISKVHNLQFHLSATRNFSCRLFFKSFIEEAKSVASAIHLHTT